MNWFATELHCHTIHSDGTFTPEELIQHAKAFGLDAIAITDHNTVSGVSAVEAAGRLAGVCVLPGVEWTTYYGHMLVQGACGCLDWYDAPRDGIDRKTAHIRAKGGLPGVAHPFRPGNPMGTGCYWEYQVREWDNIAYYEVLSGADPARRYNNQRALCFWYGLLDRGHRIAPTSGIDWHRPLLEGVPYASTWLATPQAVLTPQEMLRALNSGHTQLCIGPRTEFVLNTSHGEQAVPGDCIRPCQAEAGLLVDNVPRRMIWESWQVVPQEWRLYTNGHKMILRLPAAAGWQHVPLRVESGHWYLAELHGTLQGSPCLLSLSSPVWCDD